MKETNIFMTASVGPVETRDDRSETGCALDGTFLGIVTMGQPHNLGKLYERDEIVMIQSNN